MFEWQYLRVLLLTITSAITLAPSELRSYVELLDDPYETKLSSPTGADTIAYFATNARELSSQMIETNKLGLPKCVNEPNRCRQIGIVGAGAAGLYCGVLLAQAGHSVRIYEANNRAGGRVYTYRDPNNPSIYMGELGAMRFPLDSHSYLNHVIRKRYRLSTTSFAGSNDNAYAYINGIFGTMKELRENPERFQFNLTSDEKGKSAQALWLTAFQPILQILKRGGWTAVKKEWDSYSIDSYLRSVGMSRSAINYINILRNYESSTYCSILEVFRSALLYGGGSAYYSVEGGNDLLIEAMISECHAIESNRCSIIYSMPVNEVQPDDFNQIRLRAKNDTIDIVDTLIVATTAPAANLIKFGKRSDFVDKYRVLRQVHYACSTKILLFFNVSWWSTQEKITGGQSLTDLHLHSIYYPPVHDNQTKGGTIIAAYNLGQSSLLWQSLSESAAIELVLQELIELHRSSPNIRDYFQGGKIQAWCADPYAHGAFARFIPFQETELYLQLQTPVSRIHFIGEHTSILHGWLEGAIISALHGALAVTRQEPVLVDVIIVGGNPVGLITAIYLSLKRPHIRIAIIEKNTIMNVNEQLGIHGQEHFRRIFDEEYLVQLANMSITLWQQLEQISNLSLGSILNTNDGLFIAGNANMTQSTMKSGWTTMKRTCEDLHMTCKYLNNRHVRTDDPMFTFPSGYNGMLDRQSGHINVTTLMMALLRLIDQNSNITIREHEELLSLQILRDQTQLITSRGVLHASGKVVFIPDANVKHISRLLKLDLSVKVWNTTVYFFRLLSNITQSPNWIVLDDYSRQVIFSGFSINSTSDYLMIRSTAIQNTSNLLIDWVSRHLSTVVNISDYYLDGQTYLTTSLPDQRFLLDYVSRTNKRILIQAINNEMTFASVWADMLSELILSDEMNTSSKYRTYLDYLSFSQSDRLIRETVINNRGFPWLSSPSLLLLCSLLLLMNMHKLF